ncbi:MAG: efflux RND transporter periplasmic adaptor subunit [Saprospiraceae bacterium]|nr:efflux RND transporter periplasmic adaptor subunit [Saprospiraceae bacterium]
MKMSIIKNGIILGIAVFFAACGGKEQPAVEAAAEQPALASGTVYLTKAQIQQAGIQTGTYDKRHLAAELPVNGEMLLNKENTALVSVVTDGVLTNLKVRINQSVRKGEILATLFKPNLVDLQQQFLENRDKLQYAQAEYDRYKNLRDADATAGKNLSKAEAELRAARTLDQVLGAKLKQYQIDPASLQADKLHTEILLRAPISGTVTEVMAGTGTAMSAGSALCEISDFSQLHPVFYVFEKDLSKVKNGQKVNVRFPSEPGVFHPARVYDVEHTLDPMRKSVRVHARFERQTPEHAVSGAFLDARLLLGGDAESNALPSAAVIREQDEHYIFILEKEDAEGATFRKVAVRTGGTDSSHVAVSPVEDLTKDARIVVKGAYYVSAQGAGLEVEE